MPKFKVQCIITYFNGGLKTTIVKKMLVNMTALMTIIMNICLIFWHLKIECITLCCLSVRPFQVHLILETIN